jgi:hypothetical protein
VSDLVARDADDAYALGLWCADGYWWSSSIGLSNVEPELIEHFGRYLIDSLSSDRLRLRVYEVAGQPPDKRLLAMTSRVSLRPAAKMRRTAYHVYVNSRPLLRRFFRARVRLEELPLHLVGPYIAGRFDGDGCLGSTPRIAYTNREEAETDRKLLAMKGVVGTSVLHYSKVNEFCVYIHRADLDRFIRLIRGRSWKIGRLTL